MGLTSAFYSGLSGLTTNGMKFEVIGNNIANVNTTGFKASRVLFQTQFSRTMSIGSLAADGRGGTNPMQVGLGTKIAIVDTDHTVGPVNVTGINSDMAIEGQGYFVQRDQNGQLSYTRNGAFSVNNAGYLVSGDGKFIQGFQVDENFEVVPGTTGNLRVPLGFLTIARATNFAEIQGNLNADTKSGDGVATQGTILNSPELCLVGGGNITSDTLLTDIALASNPTVALFAVGDEISLTGDRGGKQNPMAIFTVDADSRIGHSALTDEDNCLARFFEAALGIDTNADAHSGSVVVDSNRLVITGNPGLDNSISLSNTAVRINTTQAPFTWTQTQAANGESVYTSFTVYDSLGNPMTMGITFTLEEASSGGTVWRFIATSVDDTDIDQVLGNGTITFDNQGQYVTSSGTQLTIDRDGVGAVTPQAVELDFSSMTALSSLMSEIALSNQNGVPIGTLSGFGVGNDGIITGTFTNGLMRNLGQVALATFANPKGLLEQGNSTYIEGPNSGVAIINAPLSMSAGSIQAGALELSNVDLSGEFVGLITTSTGFTAASRVISTADEMMREILSIVR